MDLYPRSHDTVSAPNQSEWWDSGLLAEGQSFTFTFTTPGTYQYYDNVDPQVFNGTVVVQTPAPEFPGFMVVSTAALGVLFGLLVEGKFRN